MGMNDEVSKVWCLDEGSSDLRPVAKKGMRERGSFQYVRNSNPNWPFRFSIKGEIIHVNRARQSTRYESAQTVGEALL